MKAAMTKLTLALGCLALLAAFSSAAYGDAISFTFVGGKSTPLVTIDEFGGISVSSAVLLAITDTDSDNIFYVPGTVDISTGPADSWITASTILGDALSADFSLGGAVTVTSAFCGGVCLSGSANGAGAYLAIAGGQGSFQGIFQVDFVDPSITTLFGKANQWYITGSDSFSTSNNSFDLESTSATAQLGQGGITFSTAPEPGTLALLGSGVVGLAGLIRRKLN